MSQSPNPELEKLREYFFNPEQAESAADLMRMTAVALMAMANIYETKTAPADSEFVAQAGESQQTQKMLDVLKDVLQREATTRIFDEKFVGQIHPHGNKLAIIGQLIGAFMNSNTVVKEVSSAENVMEQQALERMAGWFGFDQDRFSGNIVSGGTMANLAALWVAREDARLKYPQAKKFYIVGTEMNHYSIRKIVNILGNDVEFIEAKTDGFKTDPEDVRRIASELAQDPDSVIMAMVGLAGETETGEIDDLVALGQIAQEYGIFFHVDAAYGGPFILSEAGEKFAGIELADSITIDPHKMLYVPYEAGAILFKDKRQHFLIDKLMGKYARYLLKEDELQQHGGGRISDQSPNGANQAATNFDRERNFGLSRPEGSLGAGGVIATWATLELMSDAELATLLNHTIHLTKLAHELVSKSENLRSVSIPETNTLLIGLKQSYFELSAAEYSQLIEGMQEAAAQQGFYISLNEAVDQARPALRLVVMNPHTSSEDIEELMAILDKAAQKKTERQTQEATVVKPDPQLRLAAV